MDLSEKKDRTGIGFFYHDQNGDWKKISEIPYDKNADFMSAAHDLKMLYDAFVAEGFSEEDALTIVIETIKAGVRK